MKSNSANQGEVLILSDGKILAHNITPEIAAILCELDPQNDLMRQRAARTQELQQPIKNELPRRT